MNIIFHLRVVGVLLVLLVLVNVLVPRRFHWRREMASLSLVNRQIFEVHAIFIGLTLAMFAALLLTCAPALVEPTTLARAVLGGLTVFWFLRLLMQWFYYSPRLWRGQRFNTTMHLVFTATWVYFTATFAAALWQNLWA
jgi:hypothetical protein